MTFLSTHSTRSRLVLAAIVATVVVALGSADVALAHTEFNSSAPSDGAVVDGPLEQVVVNFTNAAKPAGAGFELLDPSGTIRTPTSFDATDGTSFVLRFDPPLGAGTYGVRWKVQAGDAHPIEGSFVFDVTSTASATQPGDHDMGSTEMGSTEMSSTEMSSTEMSSTEMSSMEMSSTEHQAESLDEFLAASSTGHDAIPIGRAGRVITFTGTILGIGALASLVWVMRGRRDEIYAQLAWIRLAGIVVATGGLVELAALQAAQMTDLSDLAATKAGLAALLKMAGGLVVWFGFHERAGQISAPAHSLSAAAAVDLATPTSLPPQVRLEGGEHRWTPTSTAAIGVAGYLVVLISFWLDGHTASKGPWALHSLLNLVHLGAAAVWGGGVFALTTVAWQRRRRSQQVGLTAMVIRFSTLAMASLTAVIVAGLTMTVLILERPGDLVTTTWGRVLIGKTLAVAVAAGMGAYNHVKLRPALERSPDDPALAKQLRTSLTIESIVFGVVVLLTAWLVASAT